MYVFMYICTYVRMYVRTYVCMYVFIGASPTIVGRAWYVRRVHKNFLKKPESPPLGSW